MNTVLTDDNPDRDGADPTGTASTTMSNVATVNNGHWKTRPIIG
jgi:hypothetical protein